MSVRDILASSGVVVALEQSVYSKTWGDLTRAFQRSLVLKYGGIDVVVKAEADKLKLSADVGDGQRLDWLLAFTRHGFVRAKAWTREKLSAAPETIPDVTFLLGSDTLDGARARILDRFVDACKRVRYGHVLASEIVSFRVLVDIDGEKTRIAANVNPLQAPKMLRSIKRLCRSNDQGAV